MKHPWSTGQTYAGHEAIYCDKQSRMDAARRMDEPSLRACLAFPDTQKSVRQFIERRLRKLSTNARTNAPARSYGSSPMLGK